MRLRDSLLTGNWGHATVQILAASALLAMGLFAEAHAQVLSAPPASIAPKVSTAPSGSEAWMTLAPKQKLALAPLENSWNGLSEGQRRKWLAISESYSGLGQAEQEKLHSRMAEWAALSPKDREAARLNFAQTKTIAKSDRSANWEAYQALSPEEREKLAQGAKPKPVGAAVAVKPVAPEKLTAVPVTRRTPEQERAAVVSQRPINRNTLLPQLPAAVSSQPQATPSKL